MMGLPEAISTVSPRVVVCQIPLAFLVACTCFPQPCLVSLQTVAILSCGVGGGYRGVTWLYTCPLCSRSQWSLLDGLLTSPLATLLLHLKPSLARWISDSMYTYCHLLEDTWPLAGMGGGRKGVPRLCKHPLVLGATKVILGQPTYYPARHPSLTPLAFSHKRDFRQVYLSYILS